MNKKIIAPCVIAFLMSLYFISILAGMFLQPSNVLIMLVCAVLLIASIAVLISVTLERLKEIRSGEEDDLSKY